MRGEQILITQRLLKSDKNPIKEDIKGISKEKIIDTILSEYYNTFSRKLTGSESNCITMSNLGSFFTDLSRLKGYIRRSIVRVRKLRIRVAILEQKPGFIKEESMTWIIERDLTRKIGFAWKQLDQRRELMIMRYLRYNDRLRDKKEEHKIKYNYEWYPFKFLKEYGYYDTTFKYEEKIK